MARKMVFPVGALLVILLSLPSCASNGDFACQVLEGLQAATAGAGAACREGLMPAEYCGYVSLAWFAEQQLSAAYDLASRNPTPEAQAALEAATKAAVEAKANLDKAQVQ